MTSPESNPKNNAELDTDTPFDFVPGVSKLHDLEKYWKARKLILSTSTAELLGEHRTELTKSMRPLKFNLTQTLASSLPGIAIQTISLHFVSKPSSVQTWLTKYLAPTLPAFSFFFLAWVMGWASLKTRLQGKHHRKIARSLFLYLDGSYGLTAQFLLSLGFTLANISAPTTTLKPEYASSALPHLMLMLNLISPCFIMAAFIIEAYWMFGTIKTRMFDLNDYLDKETFKPLTFALIDPQPTFKYILVVAAGLQIAMALLQFLFWFLPRLLFFIVEAIRLF